jgi:hypothetical protein
LVLGGFQVLPKGAWLEKTFDLSQHPHTQVSLSLRFVAIDAWDNEHGYVEADGKVIWHSSFTVRAGAQQCGHGPVGPQPRWSEIKDQQKRIHKTISHTASSLRLRVRTTARTAMDALARNKWFGIANLSVTTPSPCVHGRCEQVCDEESCGAHTCVCDHMHKGANCSALHTHSWAIVTKMKGHGDQQMILSRGNHPLQHHMRTCAAFASLQDVRCCASLQTPPSSWVRGWQYNFERCNTVAIGRFPGRCPAILGRSCMPWKDTYCVRGVSFQMASAMCATLHPLGRLCTQKEVASGCTAATGCDKETMVWTSDHCEA